MHAYEKKSWTYPLNDLKNIEFVYFVNLVSPLEEDGLLRTPGWVVPTEAASSGDVFVCLWDHVGEDDGAWERVALKRGSKPWKDSLCPFKGQLHQRQTFSSSHVAVCRGSTNMPPALRGL